MRILPTVVFMTTIAVTVAASSLPSSAVVIYPWCASYGGRMGGGQNCGFVTFQQCQATRAGNEGFCNPNPFYEPYPPPPTYSPPIRR
jgi:hypothetical protein